MVNRLREQREPNLVDAIETGAGIFTEAIGGTLMMAQVVSGPALNFGNSKEGGFPRVTPEVQISQFGPGPERMG